MKTLICGYSLVFKWSGPWTFTVEGLDSIPGWGTKIPQAESTARKKSHFEKAQDKYSGCQTVFWGGFTAAPRAKFPWRRTVYCLTILEARSLRSRCRQGQLPQKLQGEDSALPFTVSSSPRHSLAWDSMTPASSTAIFPLAS